jgi:hypothetical protein
LVSIDIFFGCNIDEEDSLIFPADIGSISICLWTRDNIDIQKQITTRMEEMLKTQTQYTHLCSFSNLWTLSASPPTPPIGTSSTTQPNIHIYIHFKIVKIRSISTRTSISPIRASTGVYHVQWRVQIMSRQALQNHIRFSCTMKCHRKQQIILCTRRVHDIHVKLFFCNVTEANYQNVTKDSNNM